MIEKLIDYLESKFEFEKSLASNTKVKYACTLTLLNALMDNFEKCYTYLGYVFENFNTLEVCGVLFSRTQILLILQYLSDKTGDYKNIKKQMETIQLSDLSDLLKPENVSNLSGTKYLLDPLNGIPSMVQYFTLLENRKITKGFLNIFEQHSINDLYFCNTSELEENEKVNFPNGYVDLGNAHGLAGCLQSIKLATKLSHSKLLVDMNVENFYLDIIRKSGYLPGEVFLANNDVYFNPKVEEWQRNSWCYGSLGITNSLIKYNNTIYEDKVFFNFLKKYFLQLHFFKELKNPFFCHGSIGIYVLLTEINEYLPRQMSNDFRVEELSRYYLDFSKRYISNNSLWAECERGYNNIDSLASLAVFIPFENYSPEKKQLLRSLYFI